MKLHEVAAAGVALFLIGAGPAAAVAWLWKKPSCSRPCGVAFPPTSPGAAVARLSIGYLTESTDR